MMAFHSGMYIIWPLSFSFMLLSGTSLSAHKKKAGLHKQIFPGGGGGQIAKLIKAGKDNAKHYKHNDI